MYFAVNANATKPEPFTLAMLEADVINYANRYPHMIVFEAELYVEASVPAEPELKIGDTVNIYGQKFQLESVNLKQDGPGGVFFKWLKPRIEFVDKEPKEPTVQRRIVRRPWVHSSHDMTPLEYSPGEMWCQNCGCCDGHELGKLRMPCRAGENG